MSVWRSHGHVSENYLVTGEFTVKSCKLQVLATLKALHPLTLHRGQLTRLVVKKVHLNALAGNNLKTKVNREANLMAMEPS